MEPSKQDTIDEKNQKEELPELHKRKSSNSNCCDICFEPYHILGKWPIDACPNSHFFCDHCLAGMFKMSDNEPVPCPICRSLIKRSLIKPHHQLFRSINREQTVKKAMGQKSNELFFYAFQYQIFEIATLFKDNKLDQLSKIKKLDASKRKILKIQHLNQLTSLTCLNLQSNQIQSVQGLEGLKNIKILNLNNNKISNVQGLTHLSSLECLSLQFNNIQIIDSFLPFSQMKMFFLLGNPIKSVTFNEFLLVQFQKLSTLSISVEQQQKREIVANFLQNLKTTDTIPRLNRLILEDIYTIYKKQIFSDNATTAIGPISLEWVSFNTAQASFKSHVQFLKNFLSENSLYGEIFSFQPDPSSPNLKDYKIQSQKIIKITCNFTSLNSWRPITKEGKQSFKIKILTPTQHFFLGICNAYIKGSANIYSEHFVGLTFWGSIYVRGDHSVVTGKLRYEEKPVMRMTLDFDEQSIRWFSNEQQVGFVPLPPQFKHSQLYFLFGMRDTDTSIQLLNQ